MRVDVIVTSAAGHIGSGYALRHMTTVEPLEKGVIDLVYSILNMT
jgi:hypothetical protein